MRIWAGLAWPRIETCDRRTLVIAVMNLRVP